MKLCVTLLLKEPNFFDFDEKLKEAIQYLGGKVFIKLNWSAPKDASWITSTRSLCCSDPADIYLLLKSSSYISDDLSILKKCSESRHEVPCCLVLKKWEEIHPGTEYRCFVLNKNLVGISQRDVTSYFKFISDNKKSISESISDFFISHVKSKISLDSYHFDLVIGPGKKIILIDIGVLNEKNNCLMFSWKELEEKKVCKQSIKANSGEEHPSYGEEQNSLRESSSLEPEFRYIDEFTNVTQNPCKHFGIPVDALHFCSGEKNVADYVQDEILNNRL
ncbi:translation initiation factor eIF2 assembly protein-like isoform X2 [Hetaerina americana]|uniref:translation initiation factor eIF2 assembly protein-like isoform X2 n=1 Tax=Hetaerina americana TaxID=62018 RepID=UPI003A7F4E9D